MADDDFDIDLVVPVEFKEGHAIVPAIRKDTRELMFAFIHKTTKEGEAPSYEILDVKWHLDDALRSAEQTLVTLNYRPKTGAGGGHLVH